jgi:hypothetical protein
VATIARVHRLDHDYGTEAAAPEDESRCSPHELDGLLAWERANIPDLDLTYRVDVDTTTFEVTVHRFLEDRPGSGRVAIGPDGEIGYADPVTFKVPALPPHGPWWGRATDA